MRAEPRWRVPSLRANTVAFGERPPDVRPRDAWRCAGEGAGAAPPSGLGASHTTREGVAAAWHVGREASSDAAPLEPRPTDTAAVQQGRNIVVVSGGGGRQLCPDTKVERGLLHVCEL